MILTDEDFEQLYTRFAPMVLRRCRALLRNEEEAVDAMQDVFVQVLKRKGTINASGLSSYLYTIATNVCLNLIRARRFHVTGGDDELLAAAASYDDSEERHLARETAAWVFSEKLASSRVLAVFHWVDGMTLQETADAVGMSVSGVRKRLAKVRAKAAVFREDAE